MIREKLIAQLEDRSGPWDIVIIGGGATGLGTAIDAATRGYSTLLLEQSDFSKGTSSRSTKLVHGGVRYLQQGNVALVRGALHERGVLRRNAPHLVRSLPFIVPNYAWWEGAYYGIGLRMYDVLAGKLGLGPSRNVSREDTIAKVPTVTAEGLRGGVLYYDAQFDDARLAINMAQTAAEHGGVPLNYMEVVSLIKDGGKTTGVVARDLETAREHEIRAKIVINATGVFTDNIRRFDDPDAGEMICPSQGVHIVLDRKFLPGDTALMVPRTDDGRVLFAIPWHDRVVVGTTDTPVDGPSLEPRPFEEELDFLTRHFGRYLTTTPGRADVRSTFAGLRPLVKAGDSKNTAALSRDHTIVVSASGLLTITGGKWTTYRKMAEDTVNRAAKVAGLERTPCVTEDTRIHGYHPIEKQDSDFDVYGADRAELDALVRSDPGLGQPVHAATDVTAAQVIWAVRNEMARTLEDVLARRTRVLFLDARGSLEAAPRVADIMASELGRDEAWKQEQLTQYQALAAGYLLD